VYIIDEVHMLSTGAFNALLKTLEEPPENVIFILATTEVQKLPATILSRCLRLDFKRVPEKTLRQGMRDICGQMEVKISEAALGLIASNADGSVRDALSLLDQCISAGEKTVTRENVIDILGTAGEEIFVEMTDLVIRRQVADALLLLDRVMADGKDVRQFMKDWVSHFRSLLMTKFIKNPEDILNMSSENVERIRKQSEETDLSYINESIVKLSQTLSDAKWSTQPRILLELCIVKMAADQAGFSSMPVQTRVSESKPASPKADRVQSEPKQVETISEETREYAPDNGRDRSDKPAGQNVQNVDHDRLWHAIFEEGETLKGSFNLLRVGTRLKEVGDNRFVVEATNEMTLAYAMENAADLESLMEKHTGRRLRMECCMPDGNVDQENEKTAEDLANEIGDKFGIHIDIQ
jgi:DNA polymerase-3 subunit gamma/tau